MNESLRENIGFAYRKKIAARNLTDISYNEAALRYLEDNSNTASGDDAAALFREITDCQFPDFNMLPEFAYFCREFTSVVDLNSHLDTSDDSDIMALSEVAYLRNTFSDKAYAVFTRNYKLVKAVYFSGMEEACEEVYYERCSHAVIPIYNSVDGILMSLYKLLLKYDLKVISACNISMNDESKMKYVLAVKNLPQRLNGRYIDFSVVLTDNRSYTALLNSLEILGAEIVMINSFPLDYTDERYGLILQLDMKTSSTEAIRLFLEGSKIRYNIIGNYNLL